MTLISCWNLVLTPLPRFYSFPYSFWLFLIFLQPPPLQPSTPLKIETCPSLKHGWWTHPAARRYGRRRRCCCRGRRAGKAGPGHTCIVLACRESPEISRNRGPCALGPSVAGLYVEGGEAKEAKEAKEVAVVPVAHLSVADPGFDRSGAFEVPTLRCVVPIWREGNTSHPPVGAVEASLQRFCLMALTASDGSTSSSNLIHFSTTFLLRLLVFVWFYS